MSEYVPDRPGGYGPGSVLAGYRLESQVGAGGMAVVFRARDERLGRLVAIKILSPALATDSGFRRRFIAESVAAAAVDDPHIIPVYEADEADGVLFIAMRFVQGGDLRDVLAREGGRLSPAQTAEFISPVASALDAAHAAGLVHRDVKPGNVLVDTRPGRPDHVYLSDFGVSKGARSSGTLTGTGQFLGTPDYSAPEQIEGGTVDGRTDQYALACVAFQLLTGALPFQRDTVMAVLMAHMRNPPPPATSLRDDLPGAVDDVIAKGMAKDPDDRYASCGDFADALREALGLVTYRPASQQTNPPRPAPAAGAHDVTARAETPAPVAAGPDASAARAATARAAAQSAGQPPAAFRKPDVPPVPSAAPSSATPPPVTAPAAPSSPSPPHATPPPATPPAATAPARPAAREAIPATVAVPPSARATETAGAGEPSAPAPGSAGGPTSPGWPSPGGVTVPPAAGAGRRRLVTIAAGAVIVVAAGAIPFALLRNGHQGNPGSSAGATTAASSATPANSSTRTSPAIAQNSGGSASSTNTANSTSTAGAAKYSLAGKNLTSAYPGAFISSLAFSPSGAALAIADPGPRAGAGTCLWRIAGASCTTFKMNAYAVAFNHQGTVLATSGELAFSGQSQATVSGVTRLWNAASGTQLRIVTNPGSKGALSVAFSPDGKTLAVGDRNGKIYLWDAASGQVVATLTDPVSKGVNSVAFSPDGAALAAADANGFSYLWNVVSRQVKGVLADPVSKGADSVAFSPDGKTLAVGDLNGRGYLWDVASGHRAATLDDPTATGALSVAFSPDGGTLAVGDFSGGSRLWDLTTNRLIVTIQDPGGKAVGSVAFSLDGATLATGDAGGSAFLWHVSLR
ncbi:WD40 repeat domain-containing serine/threonine protein kinase [Trebonia kvetii]|uniref:WD40 repeat domain-containing serine/threonine protein kinase n=1 Tax=Trebonia kvetii TaxID=2480626 RepID=UPI0016521900|nr:serine/threonine-protein kinase [Trebonia kvetii]